MFKLIQKDLIVGLKVKSLKAAIITFIVGLFFLTTFSFVFPTLLPIMIPFIVVMNSFYYDSQNQSESFMLSLPYKREDVVYSKYIFTLIILFASLILMYILYGINILNSARVMVFQDIVVSSATILVSFSIIIPIIFKYGYKLGRLIAPFITMFIGYLIFRNTSISEFVDNGVQTFMLRFSQQIGVFIYKLFNFTNYDLKSFTVSIFLILISIIGLVVFLVSNYISLRIYKNKDLA